MEHVWLRPNFRTQLLELIPWSALAMIGLIAVIACWDGWLNWGVGLGGAMLIFGLGAMAILIVIARYPRLAYREGHLLVYLLPPHAYQVPIDSVECFFIGQGPTMIPGIDEREVQAANVVVRLAEKAADWHRREVPTHLAQWCDGYIILRGAFCEPVDGDKVNELNKLLADVHRARKKAAAEAAP